MKQLTLDARRRGILKNGIELKLERGRRWTALGNLSATKLNWSTTDSQAAAVTVKKWESNSDTETGGNDTQRRMICIRTSEWLWMTVSTITATAKNDPAVSGV